MKHSVKGWIVFATPFQIRRLKDNLNPYHHKIYYPQGAKQDLIRQTHKKIRLKYFWHRYPHSHVYTK